MHEASRVLGTLHSRSNKMAQTYSGKCKENAKSACTFPSLHQINISKTIAPSPTNEQPTNNQQINKHHHLPGASRLVCDQGEGVCVALHPHAHRCRRRTARRKRGVCAFLYVCQRLACGWVKIMDSLLLHTGLAPHTYDMLLKYNRSSCFPLPHFSSA